MRDGWKITSIVSIILAAVLTVSVITVGRFTQTYITQRDAAIADKRIKANLQTALDDHIKKMKEMIGADAAETLESVKKQYAEMLAKTFPAEDVSTKPLYDSVAALIEDIKKETQEYDQAKATLELVQEEYKTLGDRHASIESKLKEQSKTSADALAKENNRYAAELAAIDAQLKESEKTRKAVEERIAAENARLENRKNALDKKNKELREDNEKWAAQLNSLLKLDLEYPAGRILSVDQTGGTATVTLGSADGLKVRTMFSVYRPTIEGLSFRDTPSEKNAAYCDVCKREARRNVSKAGVEVTRILAPHRAEVRILDDTLTEPITTGDFVYSPIWKPGREIEFVLTAGLKLPDAVADAGYESIKRLIEVNGGRVGCYIDEQNPNKEQGSMETASFIVVDDGAERNLDPELASVQKRVLDRADRMGIQRIGINEMLVRMGWRNVTPSYVFGQGQYKKDTMRFGYTGPVRPSAGEVAPLFNLDNDEAGISARDAKAYRPSVGEVSKLYDKKAPPPPSAAGKTSDLFRPRKPKSGEN
ncbi:MAG: hypothetical protein LBH00_06530 [Planctomycetaceae bacterium]|jgi:hypothetical protein|nr:hypothetical protein [Planctomycetaceae bacterium]